MKEMRKENSKLAEDNKKLTEEIYDLKYCLNIIEQNNLNSTIEIVVIPTVLNEICKDIVLNIAKQLNTIINLEEVYYVPVKINGENKIIVKLTNPDMKTNIIANCKCNKSLNLSNLHPQWPNKNVYILTTISQNKEDSYMEKQELQ